MRLKKQKGGWRFKVTMKVSGVEISDELVKVEVGEMEQVGLLWVPGKKKVGIDLYTTVEEEGRERGRNRREMRCSGDDYRLPGYKMLTELDVWLMWDKNEEKYLRHYADQMVDHEYDYEDD